MKVLQRVEGGLVAGVLIALECDVWGLVRRLAAVAAIG